jgi:hypothetical protein
LSLLDLVRRAQVEAVAGAECGDIPEQDRAAALAALEPAVAAGNPQAIGRYVRLLSDAELCEIEPLTEQTESEKTVPGLYSSS